MKNILDKIPADGFYKVHVDYRDDLSPQQRVQLIRKGNELFNSGNLPLAKKLFLTLKYSDGIIRVGDYYYSHGKPLEALEMYRLGSAQEKVDEIVFQMTQIIKKWINNND